MLTSRVRIEKDSLGEKEVPENVYYGIQTLRAVENFPITGYPMNGEFIRAIAMVKKAAATANAELEQLDEEIGKVIVQAADEIIEGKLHDQFLVDPIQGGAGTSLNMNANEVIANRGLELLGHKKGEYDYLHPNNHVNMAQSTNDVIPTAVRIATLTLLEGLIEKMEAMRDVLKEKEQEFDHVIKMGRTHLQDAVPIRLGQEFGAYRRVVERDLGRIQDVRQSLHEINLGATAVGSGLNADPKYIENVALYLNEMSGFPLYSAGHLVDMTQNTDAYTEVSSALKISMVNMSKMANDLRLMSSGPRTGLAELQLPARQPGSSIMPGKVNPVIPEMINQVAFQVIGNDHTISMASEAGQMELNVMEPVLAFNLLESITVMTNAFDSFTNYCLKDIQANEELMKEYVEKSAGIITAVSPHIGYEKASKIAKDSLASGKSIREVCLEEGSLTEEELDLILNPFEMTDPGIAGSELLEAKKKVRV
jgi:aspartate ammonia-lyase